MVPSLFARGGIMLASALLLLLALVNLLLPIAPIESEYVTARMLRKDKAL
jgi:hypothetical protein